MQIEFSEAACAAIQQLCVEAYEVHKRKVIEALTLYTPAYTALQPPAPTESEDYAEFTPVSIDDDVPF